MSFGGLDAWVQKSSLPQTCTRLFQNYQAVSFNPTMAACHKHCKQTSAHHLEWHFTFFIPCLECGIILRPSSWEKHNKEAHGVVEPVPRDTTAECIECLQPVTYEDFVRHGQEKCTGRNEEIDQTYRAKMAQFTAFALLQPRVHAHHIRLNNDLQKSSAERTAKLEQENTELKARLAKVERKTTELEARLAQLSDASCSMLPTPHTLESQASASNMPSSRRAYTTSHRASVADFDVATSEWMSTEVPDQIKYNDWLEFGSNNDGLSSRDAEGSGLGDTLTQ